MLLMLFRTAAAVGPPVAGFEATPLSGAAPLAVTFIDESSGADSYLWDFGDGFTSTAQNPVHVYASSGFFSPSQTVFNTFGTDTLTRFLYIDVIEAAVRPATWNGGPGRGWPGDPAPAEAGFAAGAGGGWAVPQNTGWVVTPPQVPPGWTADPGP